MRLVERGTPERGQKRCGGGVWRALVDWSRPWKITRVFRCRLRSTLGGPRVKLIGLIFKFTITETPSSNVCKWQFAL